MEKSNIKIFKKKDFILDYGCGVGFFSRLFNKKKYIGIEINKIGTKKHKKTKERDIFQEEQKIKLKLKF